MVMRKYQDIRVYMKQANINPSMKEKIVLKMEKDMVPVVEMNIPEETTETVETYEHIGLDHLITGGQGQAHLMEMEGKSQGHLVKDTGNKDPYHHMAGTRGQGHLIAANKDTGQGHLMAANKDTGQGHLMAATQGIVQGHLKGSAIAEGRDLLKEATEEGQERLTGGDMIQTDVSF